MSLNTTYHRLHIRISIFRKEKKRKKQEDKQKRTHESGKRTKISRQASTSSSAKTGDDSISAAAPSTSAKQHKQRLSSCFTIDNILQVPNFSKALYLENLSRRLPLWTHPTHPIVHQPVGLLIEQPPSQPNQKTEADVMSCSGGQTADMTSSGQTTPGVSASEQRGPPPNSSRSPSPSTP